jgi:alkylhydroperoxidase family enzyme
MPAETEKSITNAPIIPFVEIASLDGPSRVIFDKIEALFGSVPNSILTYLHRPEIAGAILGMIGAVFTTETSTLPRSLKSKLGIICSAINGCVYCTTHQCSYGQNPGVVNPAQESFTSEAMTALISGKDLGSDQLESVCFEYARVASNGPSDVTSELLIRMKATLSTAQIVELAAVVGLWKFFNAIHDSLHLPLEDQLAPYGSFFEARSGGR